MQPTAESDQYANFKRLYEQQANLNAKVDALYVELIATKKALADTIRKADSATAFLEQVSRKVEYLLGKMPELIKAMTNWVGNTLGTGNVYPPAPVVPALPVPAPAPMAAQRGTW